MLIPFTEDAHSNVLSHARRKPRPRHRVGEITLTDRQHRLGAILDNYARDFPGLFNSTGGS